MGPLFQLAFFAVLYVIVAVILGSILAAIVAVILEVKKNFRKTDGQKKSIPKGLRSRAFFYPFKLIPYFFLCIVLSVFICEKVRGVDAPFTDYWSIPIDGEIQLLAIDIPDRWNFSPVGGGESLSGSVRTIAIAQKMVFGELESGVFYFYHFDIKDFQTFSQKQDFEVLLSQNGIDEASAVSPNTYYNDMRFWGDVLMLLIIFVYPLYSLYRLALDVIRTP